MSSQEVQVSPHTNSMNPSPVIVCALSASSNYAIKKSKHNHIIKTNHCDNDYAVRFVSPYFTNKENDVHVLDNLDKSMLVRKRLNSGNETLVVMNMMSNAEKTTVMSGNNGKEIIRKKRKEKPRSDGLHAEIENVGNDISDQDIQEKKEQTERKRKEKDRVDQPRGNIKNAGKNHMLVKAMEIDSDCFGRENSEKPVKDGKSPSGVVLDFQQEAGVPVVRVKHEGSHGECKEKENGSEFPIGSMNGNEGTVVSADFLKNDSKEKKRRKRKMEPPTDQTCGGIEIAVKPLLEKRQSEGDCYDEREENEQPVEYWSTPRGVSLDLQGKADNSDMLVKYEVKHEDVEETERRRKLLVRAKNDCEKRLVSPFFAKSDHKVKVKEEKKSKRKKKIQNDLPYGEDETESFDVTLPKAKAISPYFMKKEAHDSSILKTQNLKEIEKKVRKQRNSRERTREGDEELEREVKKSRKNKKNVTLIDQCCTENNDENKTLVLGLPCLNLKVENEVAHESACRQYLINQRCYEAKVDGEDESGETDSKKDCADHGISHEVAFACFGSAKTKRVKSLHQLKVEKSEDGLDINGGEGGSDVMISSINQKVEKKKRKKTASRKCDAAGQEDDLVPSSMDSRKEKLTHDIQDCQKASPTKAVSPYFQKLSEEDAERDESNCKCQRKKTVTRTMNIKFEELLSKFTYKGGNHMNSEVGHGGRNKDDSAGKGKKDKKHRSDRNLSAAQKRGEAYRKKARDCTWKPPISPYDLLQEDHADDPWRVLVICLLLNVTTGGQVCLYDVYQIHFLYHDIIPFKYQV